MKMRLEDTKYVHRDQNGRLRMAEAVGPVTDIHTHLALTYVPTGRVDLSAPAEPQVYLDPDLPLDFEIYMNRNFKEDAMKRMKQDLSIGSLKSGGMRATHTAPALTGSMDDMGVKTSLILAIDFPFANTNTDAYLTVAGGHDNLLPAAAVHPLAKNAEKALRDAVARGARCLKMHPAAQQMKPDHPKAMRLYELCGELGIPVMWHCGPVGIVSKSADERCRVKHYWEPIHDLPNTTFVLGHSGALQYEMGVKLAQMYENTYLEVACQGQLGVDHILKTAPTDRILNGSDWPFYHQAVSVVKICQATEGNEALRRKVLYENFARVFNIDVSTLEN